MDYKIFEEFAYTAFTEIAAQQLEIFNQASRNTILLTSQAPSSGAGKTWAGYDQIQGLVRLRDPESKSSLDSVALSQSSQRQVKIMAGTPPVDLQLALSELVARPQSEAGVVVGRQLAVESLRQMLNLGLSGLIGTTGGPLAAIPSQSKTVLNLYQGSGEVPTTLTQESLVEAEALFGDKSQDITAWVLHSKPFYDLIRSGLKNEGNLFNYGNVYVLSDAMGRPFIVSDSPALVDHTSTPSRYRTLGLVPGGLRLLRNNDFLSNIQQSNGEENIKLSYQSQWSYELLSRGFSWAGDPLKPVINTDQLTSGTSWSLSVSDIKNTWGVRIDSN